MCQRLLCWGTQRRKLQFSHNFRSRRGNVGIQWYSLLCARTNNKYYFGVQHTLSHYTCHMLLSKRGVTVDESKPPTFFEKYRKEKVVFIPLESLAVFITCVIGVERPYLFPTVLLFLLEICFASVLQIRSKHPNRKYVLAFEKYFLFFKQMFLTMVLALIQFGQGQPYSSKCCRCFYLED